MSDKPNRVKFWGMGGLSGRLLILTIFFVLLGEFLIYVPSLVNFRNNWLNDRLAKAQIATLVLEATPENMVDEKLEQELLINVGAKIVALKRGNMRQLILQSANLNKMVEAEYDLRNETAMQQIIAVFDSLFANGDRLIKVKGHTKFDAGDFIEIIIEEKMMRDAMLVFGLNILTLSIILSLIVAAMIYLALNWLLVKPIKHITQSIVDFGHDPDRASNMIIPSKRNDEIGIAEHQLLQMQLELQSTLKEKNRLAALGLAVSKISHDLRNMLSSTQMISDRLQNIEDPTVVRLAPKLEIALDRAINFCVRTLKYGQAKEKPPQKSFFSLLPLVDDVIESLGNAKALGGQNIIWSVNINADTIAYGDSHQLFRIILNICRNAAEILKSSTSFAKDENNIENKMSSIFIDYMEDEAMQYLLIADNGPGVAKRAKQSLFSAFQGSLRPGGTGLGLAISQELAVAHGGNIKLLDVVNSNNNDVNKSFAYMNMVDTAQMQGAIFLISLPKAENSEKT